VVACLLVPAGAGATTPEGSTPGVTLNANPSDNLPDSQSITVTGAGFQAGTNVQFTQCTADLLTCGGLLGSVQATQAGTFAGTVTVTRVFSPVPPDPQVTQVNCALTPCVVFAESINFATSAHHHLTFSAPPARPTFTATSPPSPSQENSPLIIGTAPAGTTVNLFTDSACAGTPAGTGTAATFASPGIQVTVPDSSTTTFFGTATTFANVSSGCSSSSIAYTESTPGPNPDPGPVTGEFSRDLGIAYSKRKKRFRGTLASLSTECVRQAQVQIFRQRKGPDPVIGSATTNDEGRWTKRRRNAEGRFYARVQQAAPATGLTCLPAKSRTINVGATQGNRSR
jgi:hypothetical protein